MPDMPSTNPTPDRLVIALLNRASTTHRLSILNRLVPDDGSSSPFELVAERSLRLSLPHDDGLLRAFLAHDIETHGEAETLVQWAVKFTASTAFFFALQLKRPGHASMSGSVELPVEKDIFELFSNRYAPDLWNDYGQDEIYVSPNRITANMQFELLFADPKTKGEHAEVDHVTCRLASTSVHDAPAAEAAAATAQTMDHTLSSSDDGSAGGSSTISDSTAATSIRSPSVSISILPATTTTTISNKDKPSDKGSGFKARAIPASVKNKPSIQPRLSKAAALRMGVPFQQPSPTIAQHQRVKSADPTATPHATTTAAAGPVRHSVEARPQLASLKAPTIAPRLNKAALARVVQQQQQQQQQRGGGATQPRTSTTPSAVGAPSSSAAATQPKPKPKPKSIAEGGPVTNPSQPPVNHLASGPKRRQFSPNTTTTLTTTLTSTRRGRNSMHHDTVRSGGGMSIPSTAPPAILPRQNRASMARFNTHNPPSASSLTPPTSTSSKTTAGANTAAVDRVRRRTDYASTPGHKRATQSLSLHIPSLAAPLMPPRQNRASLARTTARPRASLSTTTASSSC